jgi:hypothetical protein
MKHFRILSLLWRKPNRVGMRLLWFDGQLVWVKKGKKTNKDPVAETIV